MKASGLTITLCMMISAYGLAAEALSPPVSISSLITRLGDENFKIRESATLDLWQKGDAALPELRKAALSDDPETSLRAADLAKKIEYGITPETPSGVMPLLDRHADASTNEKFQIYNQLAKLRAWQQMLKLYASELPTDRVTLKAAVKNIAIIAARERLILGDTKGALEFLEMGPADEAGLMALAAFHRSQGTIGKQIQQASATKTGQSLWLQTLYRANGNIPAARKAAETGGNPRLAAMMAIYDGDPLPWLQQNGKGAQDLTCPTTYAELAIRRWQGKPYRSTELEPLTRITEKKTDAAWPAVAALFLLGEKRIAEQRLQQMSPQDAFDYLDSMERPEEALKAMGFDPEKPDFKGWAARLIPNLATNDDDETNSPANPTSDLVRIVNFLEQRGDQETLQEVFLPPLESLAKKDPAAFMEFLQVLLGSGSGDSVAPIFATQVVSRWAAKDEGRWQDVILALIGEDPFRKEWWDWMGNLDPSATSEQKLKGFLAVFYHVPDRDKLWEKWIDLGWAAIEKAPENARSDIAYRIYNVCLGKPDVRNLIKAWNHLSADQKQEISSGQSSLDRNLFTSSFSAAGKWNESADFFLQALEKQKNARQGIRPELYAYTAASLRRSGREKQAAEYDAWAEKLALGDPQTSSAIAAAYGFGEDYERQNQWLLRSSLECAPDSREFLASIQGYARTMMEAEKWKLAAAAYEVMAQIQACPQYLIGNSTEALIIRLHADHAHAMDSLKNNREYALSTLANCHRLLPGNASLADYFFPSLRKAELMKEHDEWFEQSWSQMKAVIGRYPEGDNLLNSAAWLASRGGHHLDEAEKYEAKALSIRPYQSAFMDTMAEIQNARGNPQKAVEWSDQSVNYEPADPQIRRQNVRFRTAAARK